MRIKVSVENESKPKDFLKIGEFIDIYHAGIFIEKLLDEAEEMGKTNILVSVDFPEWFPECKEDAPY